MPDPPLHPPERLLDFTARVFEHFGVPGDDARLAATVLQSADLRAIDSHGVARLHSYVDMFHPGRIDPRAKIAIVRESASTATVDGGNGLGLDVGPKANAIAGEKAAAPGTGRARMERSGPRAGPKSRSLPDGPSTGTARSRQTQTR